MGCACSPCKDGFYVPRYRLFISFYQRYQVTKVSFFSRGLFARIFAVVGFSTRQANSSRSARCCCILMKESKLHLESPQNPALPHLLLHSCFLSSTIQCTSLLCSWEWLSKCLLEEYQNLDRVEILLREGVDIKSGKLFQCCKRVFLSSSFSFALSWLAWNPHWAWLFTYFRLLAFKFMRWNMRMALWSGDSFQWTEESNTFTSPLASLRVLSQIS